MSLDTHQAISCFETLAKASTAGVEGEEITGRFSRDGSSGFPVEPGRYHLFASLASPWSQRALIVRRLLGLERVGVCADLTAACGGDGRLA